VFLTSLHRTSMSTAPLFPYTVPPCLQLPYFLTLYLHVYSSHISFPSDFRLQFVMYFSSHPKPLQFPPVSYYSPQWPTQLLLNSCFFLCHGSTRYQQRRCLEDLYSMSFVENNKDKDPISYELGDKIQKLLIRNCNIFNFIFLHIS
jgi:hypothetical protein